MRTINESTIWLDPAEHAIMCTEASVLRETILERAVQAGKIPAARRDAYRQQYKRDRLGTVRLLASLAPGVKPSDARRLREAEERNGDDLLASARAAFPELRRRATRSDPPVVPVASTHRAGWYSRRNGMPVVKDVAPSRTPWWLTYSFDLPTGPAPFPDGLDVK
jgi:hypothetical protein